MNLSQWQDYSTDDRLRLLSEVGSAVRSREMPVQRYLLLHPEARLTDIERQQIYRWTRTERGRLKTRQSQATPLHLTANSEWCASRTASSSEQGVRLMNLRKYQIPRLGEAGVGEGSVVLFSVF
jgi:hypothetical protein